MKCDLITIIFGSPLDGWTHYGPFNGMEKAIEWADENAEKGEPYWAAPLIPMCGHVVCDDVSAARTLTLSTGEQV